MCQPCIKIIKFRIKFHLDWQLKFDANFQSIIQKLPENLLSQFVHQISDLESFGRCIKKCLKNEILCRRVRNEFQYS